MKGVILAGGFGTRLNGELVKEEDKDKPKALLDVNGEPLVNNILNRVIGLVDETYIVSNGRYFNDFIEWDNEYDRKGVTLVDNGVLVNENRLGSIGDLSFVVDKYCLKDSLLVVGGDNYFDFSLSEMVDKHNETGKSIIGLYDVGSLEIAKGMGVPKLRDGRVMRLREKPSEPKGTWISTLVYLLCKNDVSLIKEYVENIKRMGVIPDRAGDFIDYISKKGFVNYVSYSGKWYDIGSEKSLKEARNGM